MRSASVRLQNKITYDKSLEFFRKWKLYRRTDLSQFTEKSVPGVSILKPLINSADPSLFQNLETFFTLDYPKYEILFCIQETDDTKMKMYIDSLMQKYPAVQSKVFYGGQQVSVNPKINNMVPGYKAAIYEYVLISDSGIRSKSFFFMLHTGAFPIKNHILKISIFTKFTFATSHFSQNSHFKNLIIHKIHVSKISFCTKFTF